ncbi:hypothetical protein H8356DRAFT_1321726 [Neocallimastix lanati (nom. inval.)]|nr:hypothetical protein H8356DRAFT_1321726 [Neocallimastix sp. JGI-2020a]
MKSIYNNCIFSNNNNNTNINDYNSNTNYDINETSHQRVLGILIYLTIYTSSNIIFAISKAARKSKEPTMED